MNTARRPLAGLVLCMVLGTWLGLTREYDVFITLITAVSAVLCAGALAVYNARRGIAGFYGPASVTIALSIAIILAALMWSALWKEHVRQSAGPVTGWMSGDLVQLRGIVADDPSPSPGRTAGEVIWRLTLNTTQTRPDDGTRLWHSAEAPVTVKLYFGIDRPAPRYGEEWNISGTVRRVPEWDNEARAIARGGCVVSGGSGGAERLSSGHGNRFAAWCYEHRKMAADRLSAGIRDFPEYSALLNALVLGYRNSLPRQMQSDFSSTGTTHVVAISGQHVVMLAAILTFPLAALRIPRTRWFYFLAPTLIIYTVATGATASAVRACIMGVAYLAALPLRRKPDVISALAFSAMVILAWKPEQLYDLGFLYSFAVVIGIVTLYPLLDRPGAAMLEADPLAPTAEMGDISVATRLRDRLRPLARAAWSLMAMSITAWLVSTPISMHVFGRLSLISIVANLPVVPMAFMVLLSGCLSLLVGALFAPLAEIFNHASLALIAAMVGTTGLLARAPLACVEVDPLPLWGVALWYAAVALLGMLLSMRRHERELC